MPWSSPPFGVSNPELLVARSRFHWAKPWDKVLSLFMVATLSAIFVVAAFDDGRFHWLPIPWWLCGIGYVMFLDRNGDRHLGWSGEQIRRGTSAHSD